MADSKIILITGSSRGVGEATAKAFIAQNLGAQVVGVGLEAAPNFIHPQHHYHQGDITDPAFRQKIIDQTISQFGRIDILINNAATGIYAPSYETSYAETLRLYDVNVFAPMELIRLALPHMQKQTTASIVNIGSICCKVTVPWATTYCATKFALDGQTQGLQRELRNKKSARHIHVMFVMPAVIDTNFRAFVVRGEAPKNVTNMRLLVRPEYVAKRIIAGVAKKKKKIYVPFITAFPFMKMQEYTPWLMDLYLRSKQR